MKHFILTLLLFTSYFSFSQLDTLDTRRNFGSVEFIYNTINTAEDALFYLDSLTMEYERSPFYVINYFGINIGERVDGKIVLSDLNILYQRLTAQEAAEGINKTYKKLIEAADIYFDKRNYEKAYPLYKKAHNIKPSDKGTSKKMMKTENFLNRQKSARIWQ